MQNQKAIRSLSIKELSKHCFEFVKFSVVGISNTIISTLFYYMFLKLGLHYIIANTLAYAAGMINSYLLNKRWVFKCGNSSKTTLPRFIIVNLAALASSNVLLYLIVHILRFSIVVAQPTVTVIIVAINYTGNKIWTFKNNEKNYRKRAE